MRNNSEIMSRGIEETDQHFTCAQGELPGWSRCSKSKKNNNKKNNRSECEKIFSSKEKSVNDLSGTFVEKNFKRDPIGLDEGQIFA